MARGGRAVNVSIPRARAGFTLVEVMVALVVMGVVLAGARAMLGQIADDADRITAAASDADREANAEGLLRVILGRLEVSPMPGAEVRFEGEPHGMRFHTWCDVPDGWLERCEASLGFIDVEEEKVLALRLSTGELVPLRQGSARASSPTCATRPMAAPGFSAGAPASPRPSPWAWSSTATPRW